MLDGLTPGAQASLTIPVTPAMTVPALPLPEADAFPPVLATGVMVAFAEMAAHTATKPYLEPGEGSVGIEVCFTHTAATPVGMRITAEATLTETDGRVLAFDVVLRDEAGEIGRGTHRRAVIDRARFDAKLTRRSGLA